MRKELKEVLDDAERRLYERPDYLISPEVRQRLRELEEEERALAIIEQLVVANVAGLPSSGVYDSGITYRIEASEAYATAQACLARGHADAAEIVAWRCAELRAAGVDAKPMLCRHPAGDALGIFYYTAKVLLPDGSVEDVVERIRGRKPPVG